MSEYFTAEALSALLQVIMIDLVLAGDNAVAVGLAAAGLAKEQRRKVIVWGLVAAVVMRIGFALITTQLLAIIGLLVAGGVLLLWVCWKMWRDLRANAAEENRLADAALDIGGPQAAPRAAKTFRSAFTQILVADLSMSLDNVLAVAGAAREHPSVLIFGLLMSVALMGVAASWIARLLHRYQWIGYVGLIIVLYVAFHMIWEGGRTIAIDTHQTAIFNAWTPDGLDISPDEIAKRIGGRP